MEEISGIRRDTSSSQNGYRPFFLVVLFFALYLAYLILRPFLHTIILATILASLFYPFQSRLVRLYRGRKNLAALTVIAVITFVIVIPIFFLVSALVSQGLESVDRINAWISAGNMQRLLEDPKILVYTTWIRERLGFLDFAEMDIQEHLLQLSRSLGQFLLSRGASLMRDVASMVFHFLVMIFISFYLV
ncbi:MAG: AI-2E family transporter, partial [Candidatus Aerophobus sp.]